MKKNKLASNNKDIHFCQIYANQPDFFISISSLFDSAAVRNMTLEDIREMGRGDDLASSPTDPSAVHRSFVQEQQNEQLAIARNLRRSVNLP